MSNQEQSLFEVSIRSVYNDFDITTLPVLENTVKEIMAMSRDPRIVDVHLPLQDGRIMVVTKDTIKTLVFSYKAITPPKEEEAEE